MAPLSTTDDLAAVHELIRLAFDSIWSGTDTAAVARYHTPDFIILEHGEVWTNDTIRNFQLRQAANQRPDSPKRHNRFEFLRTEQVDSDHIWTAYENYANGVLGLDTVWSMSWLESAVAVRTATGWKLEMMHSTRRPSVARE